LSDVTKKKQVGNNGKKCADSSTHASKKWNNQEKMKKLEIKNKQKGFIICAELLVIGVMFFFLFGKDVGTIEYKSDVQTSVTERGEVYKDAPQEQEFFALENEKAQSEEKEIEEEVTPKTPGENKTPETGESDKPVREEPSMRKDFLLVNKDNALPEDYEVELKLLPDGTNKAAVEAYEPLCDMLAAGRKEGLVFEICSSYRDVKKQQKLFDEDLRALTRQGYTYEEAYEEVASETMPPGHSEHSTGLAFDIVAMSYQMLNEKQAKTAESIWLREHCAEYGFILRYPEGKEDITKINYESWHFRYLGDVEVATYIMENGLTLEEYLEE